ncbi:MAG: hypothetical protein QM728_03635 [Gordonia sp. (in: high G+C Gram-positive bacteria)]|uniref:hypothetical protein n=1 Tax=Gordonia sp. (in: high G+C Gram-positive bacteria) TaxID=84139 RepID=UPI0039E38E0F
MSSDDKPKRREIDFEALERNKDLAQEAVQGVAARVGKIATIITGAVVDVAREIGDAFTDGFEMREAAKKAKADSARAGRLADDRVDDEQDALDPPSSTIEILDAEVETDERD